MGGEEEFKRVKVERDDRWWSRVLQEIFVFVAVNYIFWQVPVLLLLYALTHVIPQPYYLLLIAPLVGSYLYFSFLDGCERKLGRPWPAFRSHPMWNLIHRHNGIEVVRTRKLQPGRRYVIGCHPHGILVLSRVFLYGGIWEKLFPGIDFRVLGATPMFFIPFCREMCLWMGAIDASKKSAERALEAGKSIHVYPGGSKEIFETRQHSKETTLVLKDRKGFIKLAMKYGCELVPVVVYGEKAAYNKLELSPGVKSWFLKNLKVPLLLFWGKYFTWMPLRNPMAMVFGAPIPVEVNPNPTEEQVDELHQLYMKKLSELFEEHKPNYPFAKDQELIIK